MLPFIHFLDEALWGGLGELEPRFLSANPPEADDVVLFPFRRIFMIGRGAC